MKNICEDCGVTMTNTAIVKAWKNEEVYYVGKGICGVCSNKRYKKLSNSGRDGSIAPV